MHKNVCYVNIGEQNIGNLLSVIQPSNPLSTVYFIYKNGLDIKRGFIPNQKLTCYNVNIHFNTDDTILTDYCGPMNVINKFKESAAIIIFSNNHQEILKCCDHIQTLCRDFISPYIFVATSLTKDQIDFPNDKRIAKIISYPELETSALDFWKTIRQELDQIAEKILEQQPQLEYQSEQCRMM